MTPTEVSNKKYLDCLMEMYEEYKSNGFISTGYVKKYSLNHHFINILRNLKIINYLYKNKNNKSNYHKWISEKPSLLMVIKIKQELSSLALKYYKK